MNITIYGLGYVGLVTGACMAEVGNNVLCIDTNDRIINILLSGSTPVFEPGLNKMIKENISAGRLKFSQSPKNGVEHGLYQFIAVSTPLDDNGSVDLSYILETANSIAEHMTSYRVIINKSTVPVGTADKVREQVSSVLENREQDLEFDVVSNPEFLKEGAAIDDFMKPDRIIIGTDNPRTTELMRELYATFNNSRDRLVAMDVRSAELTKYAANALLATKISFMNELSNLAEHLGADIEQVRQGIGSDPRIGYHFIYPGCGYGGAYFPKDVQALERTAEIVGYNAELLSAVEAVNYRQKEKPFEKLKRHYGEKLKGKTIALWGLAFKPNTDDMHEASSRVLMESLWEIGAKVRAYDPVAKEECERIYGNRDDLHLCNSTEDTLQGADALAIVTEWQEFRSQDFEKIKTTLKDPVIVDGRNLYDPKRMEKLGFDYYAIGRGK